MGLFNFLNGAFKVLEWLDDFVGDAEAETADSVGEKVDLDELISDIDEYLDLASCISIDDVDKIISCISRADKKLVVLWELDIKLMDDNVTREYDRLQSKRDDTIVPAIQDKYIKILDDLNAEEAKETDAEKSQELNKKWFSYAEKQQRLFDYEIGHVKEAYARMRDFLDS